VLGQDATFTLNSFIDRYNADLANDYGNLVNRIFILINKYFDDLVPKKDNFDSIDLNLISDIKKLEKLCIDNYNIFKIHDAIDNAINIFRKLNKYLEVKSPWKTIKKSKNFAGTTLYIAIESLRIGTILLYPIIPNKAKQVLNSINSNEKDSTSFGLLESNKKIKIIKNIFPRII